MKLAFETALLQKVNDVCLAFAGSTIDDANKYLTIQTCKNKVYMYVSDGFGIFSLVRTTNVEFQDLVMRIELSVFKDIARNCQTNWSKEFRQRFQRLKAVANIS